MARQEKLSSAMEVVLRSLLDLPGFAIKTKLLKVLCRMKQHSMVFGMTLADTLNRLYSLEDVIKVKNFKFGLEAQAQQRLDVNEQVEMLQ